MDPTRQQKVSKLLQQELAAIFQKRILPAFPEAFLSVVEVRVNVNFSLAKVYLSVFNTKDREALMQSIMLQKTQCRKDLSQRIGKKIRHIPELVFVDDHTEEHAQRLQTLLKGVTTS